jgi:hypothetical protein
VQQDLPVMALLDTPDLLVHLVILVLLDLLVLV